MKVRRPLSVLLAVVVAVVLLAVVAGSTWIAITPTVGAQAVRGGFTLSELETAKAFDAIAVFVVVMMVYGLVAALLAWFVARPWRGVVGYGLVLLATIGGSALAIQVAMWLNDWLHGDRSSVKIGDTVELIPRLWLRGGTADGPAASWILLICAPFIFTLVYLICVLASRTADLGVGDLDDDHRDGHHLAASAPESLQPVPAQALPGQFGPGQGVGQQDPYGRYGSGSPATGTDKSDDSPEPPR